MEIVKDEPKTELITRTLVESTPFVMITNNEKNKTFGVLGKYRITEEYDTPGECEEQLRKFTWDRLIQITSLLIEILKTK